jgi:RNA 2',3'-cyclic 3'-phosphodiesterase
MRSCAARHWPWHASMDSLTSPSSCGATAADRRASMRLFLAIELPAPLLDALESAIAPLRAEAPEIAWVPVAKRHLTLKFLGDVGEERLDSLVVLADRVAREHRAFSMQLAGLGAFPNFRRARVVWIGVESGPRLELLHHDLELALERVGFEVEGRPFRPHVTVSRVRAPLAVERVRALARAARGVDFSATQPVAELVLFESTLASSGVRYRREHAATLGGR